MTNKLLNTLIQTEKAQENRLRMLKEYEGLYLKLDKASNGSCYYSVASCRDKEGRLSYKYLGKEPNDTVSKIKEARHLKKSLKVLGINIRVLQTVMDNIKECSSEAIDQMLPETYRGALLMSYVPRDQRAELWKRNVEARKAANPPAYPEELIHKTDDGTMVRSKSEAIIYNLLLRLGITFVYEPPVKLKNRMRYPDFALLSEVDYRTVILIEHQGMMNDPGYAERFKRRVVDYLYSGYVPGVNIYYTFDGMDGSINTDPILDIISLKIRPALQDRG